LVLVVLRSCVYLDVRVNRFRPTAVYIRIAVRYSSGIYILSDSGPLVSRWSRRILKVVLVLVERFISVQVLFRTRVVRRVVILSRLFFCGPATSNLDNAFVSGGNARLSVGVSFAIPSLGDVRVCVVSVHHEKKRAVSSRLFP
jgi:hypothetical protein